MATQQGYFLIADITGYTQYLSASELDHAQQTLTALLNLLIQQTKPPLIISRLAGDAVISYGLRDRFYQGQTFVETIEETYVRFRRAIDLMVHNTTCPCNACRNIGSLDLKFFVHYGEFGIQKLDAHDELVGSDVNLIHRLLKNTVGGKLGLTAYTMFSDAAIRQLGLAEATGSLIPHSESYEHLGIVHTWVQDMHAVWDRRRSEASVTILPEQELARGSAEFPLSRQQLWDYLVQPEHFNVLLAGTGLDVAGLIDGRVGAGTVYRCYHGGHVSPQTVLEWQPFERMTFQFQAPVPIKGTYALWELRLEPNESGTRLVQIFAKPTGPLIGRVIATRALRVMGDQIRKDIEAFRIHIETDLAKRPGAGPAIAINAEAVTAAARQSLLSA